MKRSGPRGFALCLALAVGLFAPAALAEEPATPPAEVAKAAPTVEPIPVEQIAVASQRAQRIFNEMVEGLAPSEGVENLQKDLPELRSSVSEALRNSQTTRSRDASVLALDHSSKQLNEARARLDKAQRVLGERAAQVAAQIENARSERKVWQATREAAVAAEVDPGVVAPIDEVERTIKGALKKATERQASIVELQSEVAGFSEKVTAEREATEALRLSLVGKVFQRDQPPLWSRDFWTFLTAEAVGERLAAQREQQLGSIVTFYEQNREQIVRHLILTLLFAALAFYLKPIARRIFSGEDLITSVRAIFDGPIVLTALVSFLLALFWMTAEAAALAPFLGAATLIPAVILLRRIVGPPLYTMLNALVLFFIIGQVRTITAPLAVVGRLVFVTEIAAVILVILYLLRPSRLAEIPDDALRSPIFRSVGIGLRIALLVAVCALVAEVIGYGALAHLLAGTVATSGYAAAIFYGAVRIADGLVAFALRVRPLNQLGMVRRHRSLLRRRAERALSWVGWLIWAAVTLRTAELLEPVENTAAAILAASLPLPEVAISVGDLLSTVLTLWAAVLISRFLRFVLDEDVFTRMRLPKGRPYAISTLFHYVILLVGFVLATMALGFDLNRFTLLAGAFGVGIGFGLQTIVNNFVSGIILLTERPVELGDTISLEGVFGQVERIGIRSSTVRSWQGAEIIVPNADLVALQVTNWTLSDRRRRMEIPVGVAYGSDPRRVMELLKDVAGSNSQVLPTPEPYVLFNGFGDSSLDFEIRAWTDDFDSFLQIRSAICVAVVDALNDAGIVIPFPQRDLHVKEITASRSGEASPAPETRDAEPTTLPPGGEHA